MQSFRENVLTYTLVPLLICVVVIAYVRYMVLNDYIVAYEGDCDPYTESCYIGCEDDECTEEYYYTVVQKYAPNVEAQCGVDITDCDAAYECLPEDGDQCEITYCDPLIDGEESCETLTEADYEEEIIEEDPVQEPFLFELDGEAELIGDADDVSDDEDTYSGDTLSEEMIINEEL